MEAKAIAKNLRIAPRKTRLVADLVRGKSVVDAIVILANTNKAASPLVEKVLRSAVANALNNHMMDEESLYVKEILVNEGATMHRMHCGSKGMANFYDKRTSHISVVIGDKVAAEAVEETTAEAAE